MLLLNYININLWIEEINNLSDEKFAEKAAGFSLLKNTDGVYFTPEEYKEKIQDLELKLKSKFFSRRKSFKKVYFLMNL